MDSNTSEIKCNNCRLFKKKLRQQRRYLLFSSLSCIGIITYIITSNILTPKQETNSSLNWSTGRPLVLSTEFLRYN